MRTTMPGRWSGERRTAEGAGHLHPHTHHGDVAESLDALLARLEARDADEALPVRVQIIRFPIDRAVRAGEDKRVVHQTIERRNVARELGAPEGRLAGAQGIVRQFGGRTVVHAGDRLVYFTYNFGRLPCQMVACSYAYASASTVDSAKGAPTIWRPIGRPPLEKPHGTLMAGRP